MADDVDKTADEKSAPEVTDEDIVRFLQAKLETVPDCKICSSPLAHFATRKYTSGAGFSQNAGIPIDILRLHSRRAFGGLGQSQESIEYPMYFLTCGNCGNMNMMAVKAVENWINEDKEDE